MTKSSGPSRRVQGAIGVAMIVGGALLLLDFTGVLEIATYWHVRYYWPLIIVVVGVVQLAGFPDVKSVSNGLWTIFIGVWLFLVIQHMFGLTFRNSWPVFVVAWGVKLLGEALFARQLSASQEGK